MPGLGVDDSGPKCSRGASDRITGGHPVAIERRIVWRIAERIRLRHALTTGQLGRSVEDRRS